MSYNEKSLNIQKVILNWSIRTIYTDIESFIIIVGLSILMKFMISLNRHNGIKMLIVSGMLYIVKSKNWLIVKKNRRMKQQELQQLMEIYCKYIFPLSLVTIIIKLKIS